MARGIRLNLTGQTGCGKTVLKNMPDELLVSFSLSLGVITVIPNGLTTMETLYISCDKALYEAKRNGRNRVVQGNYDEPIAIS